MNEPMTTEQQAILQVRCENWGEWARRRDRMGDGYARCGSAEGRYVAPRDDDNTRSEQQSARCDAATIDAVDAERIEAAWSSMRYQQDRTFLVEWYKCRRPPAWFRRRPWNLPGSIVRGYLVKCLGALQYRLDAASADERRCSKAA